ncbi:helix-turn-helix domain-containing protein [Archangium sp.]|uniref:helix-turn-helix domain-containing protein n=1 Tax=Archangium sp. TaxID=1872627 RepID=UPI0038D4F3DC
MHTNRRSVAQALLAARQRKGWSQYRLAVRAGLHPNTVSLAERSGHFTERTAARLAAALDVPVESLRPSSDGAQG